MSELLHRVEAASTSQLAPLGLPLCIDLDGTLLRIDSLFEATFSAILADWRVLFHLPRWLAEGRAHLKQELAARWEFVAAQLPYDQGVRQLIEVERARGRRIVLCTAVDERIANAVATHLGLFDDVIASDGSNNLRGERKATELCRRFGERGFVYAGNDSTDYAVWRHAARQLW